MSGLRNLNQAQVADTRAFVLPEIQLAEVSRPQGYVIDAQVNIRASARMGHLELEGFGSGDLASAREKSISELVERYVLIATGGGVFATPTSNGWAAHTSLELALEAATLELIERDSILRNWFDNGFYHQVPATLWPLSLQKWRSQSSNLEFSQPKVAVSLGPNGACISVFIMSQDGRTLVGHAANRDLTRAIEGAFSEALRSAHSALRLDAFNEVRDLHNGVERSYSPSANALAYAYGEKLPELKWTTPSEDEFVDLWKEHQRRASLFSLRTSFTSYRAGTRYVVSVYSPDVIDLFWGPTPSNYNANNRHPHFVG